MMRKEMKKASVIALSAALLSGGVLPVYAASADPVAGVSGEQADISGLTGTITVQGVTSTGVTVKAYQVVDGVYQDNKLVKYVLMDPTNANIAAIGDDTKGQTAGQNDIITNQELSTIAQKIHSGDFTADAGTELTKADGSSDYTASVEPGMYVVLVSGAADKTYNPAVVAVNLSDADTTQSNVVSGGTVDLTQYFQTYDGTNTTNVYLKSSNAADMDKSINVVENETSKKVKGDTSAYGDTVSFTLDNMTIPAFTSDTPVYKITDTLEAGAFGSITGLTVKVNNGIVSEGTDTYSLTEADGSTDFGTNSTSFCVNFAAKFLNDHKNDATRPTVEITYTSTLTEKAGLNYDENFNHAVLTSGNDEASATKITKNTYHYTFGIGAKVDGETDTTAEEEFKKVKKTTTGESTEALEGAVFTIYTDEACQTPIKRGANSDNYTATSDNEGRLTFVGLDKGTYYIKETTAPKGYSISPFLYKFEITPTIDDSTGIMTNYTVAISSKNLSTGAADWTTEGTATYKNGTTTTDADGNVKNDVSKTQATVNIVDPKIQGLPSTGARGALVLSLVGACGMSFFLAMYMKNGKKNKKQA